MVRFLSATRFALVVLTALAALLPASAHAANGDLDPTFGSSGLVTTDLQNGSSDLAWGIAIQSDGKIVAVGSSVAPTRVDPDFAIARYDTDGSLDSSFGNGGLVFTDFANHSDDTPVAVAIQSDGRIVVVGDSNPSGNDDVALARYNADGSLDPSFGTGGLVTTNFNGGSDRAYDLAIQAGGKIIVLGATDSYGGSYLVARYNSDGTLDASFGDAGWTDLALGQATSVGRPRVALTDTGQIIAVFTSPAHGGDFEVTRLTSGGILDLSFGNGGETTTDINNDSPDSVSALGILPDGKIVVGGTTLANTEGAPGNFALARYTGNGALDSSFGTGGVVITDFGGSDTMTSLVMQPNGELVAGGVLTANGQTDYFALARYLPGGSPDPSFGASGLVSTAFPGSLGAVIEALALQTDGKIVAAGLAYDSSPDFALARYQASSSGCTADATHLCLTGGRFQVSVQWTDYNTNVTAAATAVPFVDESGFFYFQDPANIEIMVKVHNACAGFGHFWFFSAATTNVGYTITVTDTKTGQTETYSNPAHVLSAAVTDQSSFGSCP